MIQVKKVQREPTGPRVQMEGRGNPEIRDVKENQVLDGEVKAVEERRYSTEKHPLCPYMTLDQVLVDWTEHKANRTGT